MQPNPQGKINTKYKEERKRKRRKMRKVKKTKRRELENSFYYFLILSCLIIREGFHKSKKKLTENLH